MSVQESALGLGLLAPSTDRGVSSAARDLRTWFAEAVAKFREPESLGGQYRDALRELEEAVEEAEEASKIGEAETSPPQRDSYVLARRVLEIFPTSVPMPEMSLDPDGEVAMDWIGGRGSMFSVSIGADGTLSYAGRFGVSRVHGSEVFSDELPEQILAGIHRAYS